MKFTVNRSSSASREHRFIGAAAAVVACSPLILACSAPIGASCAAADCGPYGDGGARRDARTAPVKANANEVADGSGLDGGAPADGGSRGPDAGGSSIGDAGHGTTSGDARTAQPPSSDAHADAAHVCDETKSPREEPCLVSDERAVFVAPGGSGRGTMAEPAANLSTALVIAHASGKSRIIVCTGTYDEHLSVTGATGGAAVFGGFKCPSDPFPWTYDGAPTARALVKPTSPGPALHVAESTAGLTIEDVDFFSPDAIAVSGSSSIAVIVAHSTDVTLRRSHVQAGNGADGAAGQDGAKGADGYAPAVPQNGRPRGAFSLGGFWPVPSPCGSMGGRGGSNEPGSSSESGIPLANIVTPNNDNSTSMGPLNVVKDGANGANGNAGEVGSRFLSAGAFDAAGFSPSEGGAGTSGYTAQGGGGGAGSLAPDGAFGPSGGAGGIGGCGGALGSGGKGGGASVALLSWDSTLFIEDVTLESRNGGNGGRGGNGGPGGKGMSGGTGGPQDLATGTPRGGNGGKGGDGGNGGPGAGGSGGPSFGIVFHTAAPIELGRVAFIGGRGGDKGLGGSVAVSTKAPDGLAGPSADRFEWQ